MKVKMLVFFIISVGILCANPIVTPILTQVKLLDEQGNWEITLDNNYLFRSEAVRDTTEFTFYCKAGSISFDVVHDINDMLPLVVSSLDLNTDLKINPVGDSLYILWDSFVCEYGPGTSLNSLSAGEKLIIVGVYYDESTDFWWCHADSLGNPFTDLTVKLQDSNGREVDNAEISFDGNQWGGQCLENQSNGIYFRPSLPCKQLQLQTYINSILYDSFCYMGDPGTTDSITITLDNYTQGVGEETIPHPDLKIANYPNPFNPETEIVFSLKKQYSDVKIEIFNTKGQIVRSIPVSNMAIGENSVTWNGQDSSGRKAASGTYYCRVQADGSILFVNKMTLLK